MLSAEKILRINELAKKSKTVGLTNKEKEEQQKLRNEYIQAVRYSLKANLETITIVKVDEEGNETERISLKEKGAKLH